ncbi:LysM peptidoglycan-binding domain-containing protein [Candidatus Woesebacteria bacterium]|nr:LysM peptidoglycan-binding domain-containing protein [Candidatus Woesebacteria bacterium]
MELPTVSMEELTKKIRENVYAFATGLAIVCFIFGFVAGNGYGKSSVSQEVADTQSSGEQAMQQKDELVTEDGQISATQTDQVQYAGDTYVIQKGDSLSLIAQRVYGDLNAWVIIAQANNIKNPDDIEVGKTIVIPKSTK